MEIQNLMHEIREDAIEKMEKKSPYDLAASWSGEDLLYSGVGNAIFIVLPTSGCAWALSGSGGCTMCSYVADSPLVDVEADVLVDIFKKCMAKHEIEKKTTVKMFVSGSFLNEAEVPKVARDEILGILKDEKHVEEVVVESRPEYVTEEVLKECSEALGNKLFEVGMGLETSNDYTRKYKINKGFTREDFEQAVQIIKKLQPEYNVHAKAYLFVKPILTSENAAIEEAVESARYAESVGASRISFCPATIHKGTLMELLWKQGSYQPPWIWSVIEIIKRVRSSVKIPVIMDTAAFGTRRGPYNCKKCNSKLKSMIIKSNLEQNIPKEFEDFECDCKERWVVDVKFSDVTRSTTNLNRRR
ncbi:archaeosine biosynthesis radical SAM protein RaSEA [Methanobacterium paludis]|uniref:Elp3/MiaA/NifB-like radical SAM core domain-containing protein n=1 Tax=Methanobacterium paludis (strain DSM 25820 / JCM 18151 / SWAN1) TaxID=868131 RepID=F6D5U7_METPW|nr:archaeosine biosynthesis radical SAM protein RaSEA [Methanobacterium paludis]AEG18900.1 Conserved hypothetical protein CHP01210 [Methanobacterium paludis]